jgi:hypothetical protein
MKLKQYTPPTRADMAGWQDRMRQSFFEGVGVDDMREIVAGLVEKAKKGDLAAVKILLAYGIGSPNVSVTATNAVVAVGGREPAPLPAPPSVTLPGTAARVDDMARRVANGQALFSGKDRKIAEG